MWRSDRAEIRAPRGRRGTVDGGGRSPGEGGDKGRTARGGCRALVCFSKDEGCVCQAALVSSEWFALGERKQFVISSESERIHIVYPKTSNCRTAI